MLAPFLQEHSENFVLIKYKESHSEKSTRLPNKAVQLARLLRFLLNLKKDFESFVLGTFQQIIVKLLYIRIIKCQRTFFPLYFC